MDSIECIFVSLDEDHFTHIKSPGERRNERLVTSRDFEFNADHVRISETGKIAFLPENREKNPATN